MNKLKKMLKGRNGIAAVVAVLVLILVVVIVCKNMSFPSKECAKTIMTIMCEGSYDSDKDFKQISKETKEDAEEYYNKAIDTRVETLKQYFGITELTEDGEKILREFVENLYAMYTSYTIKGTDKQDDNYVVKVEVKPLAFYKLIDIEEFSDAFRKKAEDGEYATLSDAEYQTAFLKEVIKEYNEALEQSPEYLKKTKQVLTLKKSGNTYIPSQKDYDKIEESLISFSK